MRHRLSLCFNAFFLWQNTNSVFIIFGLTENESKWIPGALAGDDFHTVTAFAARLLCSQGYEHMLTQIPNSWERE